MLERKQVGLNAHQLGLSYEFPFVQDKSLIAPRNDADN
jgi:hypothetical protein